jgi:type IV pilus assembly protein PilN
MPRINLLPWREELRKQRQKNFAVAAVVAVAAAGLVILLAGLIVNGMINYQNDRNQRLTDEIARLDALIDRKASTFSISWCESSRTASISTPSNRL